MTPARKKLRKEDVGSVPRSAGQSRGDDEPVSDADSSVCSSESDDSICPPSDMGPEELQRQGREERQARNMEAAVRLFAYALERQVKALGKGSENSNDPVLAPYYLDYGEALLAKEEDVCTEALGQSTLEDVMRLCAEFEDKQNEKQDATTLDEKTPAASGDSTPSLEAGREDLQLAWENLEMARRCFEALRRDRELSDMEVDDYTRGIIRLGDLATLREDWPSAIEDFTKALEEREKVGRSGKSLYVCEASLATAHNMAGNCNEAISYFQSALGRMKSELESGNISEERKVELREAAEEVQCNIEDIKERLKSRPKDLTTTHQAAINAVVQQQCSGSFEIPRLGQDAIAITPKRANFGKREALLAQQSEPKR